MNRYYVYCHYIITTNKVFYIGKGSGRRASFISKRNNKKYNEILDKIGKEGIGYKILHSDLSLEEALRLETEEINNRQNLCNVIKSTANIKLVKEQLEYYFKISDSSESGLSRILRQPYLVKSCGSLYPDGYWRVDFQGKTLLVHRVIATLHFGGIADGMVVNHKDGVRKNNSTSNLEICTIAENNRHRDKSVGNVSVYPLVKDCGKYLEVVGILRGTMNLIRRRVSKNKENSLEVAKSISRLCY